MHVGRGGGDGGGVGDGEGHEVADLLLQRSGSATGRTLSPRSARGSAKRSLHTSRHARAVRARITYASAVHAVQRHGADYGSYKRAFVTRPPVSAEPLTPAADRAVGSLTALVTGFPGVAAAAMPPRLPMAHHRGGDRAHSGARPARARGAAPTARPGGAAARVCDYHVPSTYLTVA